MLSKKVFFIVPIMVSIMSSYINFSGYIKGYKPTLIQAISSLVCILVWTLCCTYKGYKKERKYIRFCIAVCSQ